MARHSPIRDGVVDGTFLVAMAGVAWLAVFGHRGVAPCAGFMALAAASRPELWRAGVGLCTQKPFADPLAIAALSMTVFSAWIANTAFWSPTPGAEWLALSILAAFLSAGALVFEASHASPKRVRRFAASFAAAVSLAAGALMFEGLSGGYLRGVVPPTDLTPLRWKDMTALGRGVTVIAPLVFPAAAILRKMTGSWFPAAAPVLAIFIAAAQFSVFTNVAAVIAGGMVFLAALARPRVSIVVVAAVVLTALALAPFLAALISPDAVSDGAAGPLEPSWAQRLLIWKNTADLIFDRCLPFGCGADFARALSAEGATITVPGSRLALPEMPIHPHNLFLQVWLELGLAGVATLAVAIAFATKALLRIRLDAVAVAAISAAVAAAFISVMFEASLWQLWRLAVFVLAAFGAAVSLFVNRLNQ